MSSVLFHEYGGLRFLESFLVATWKLCFLFAFIQLREHLKPLVWSFLDNCGHSEGSKSEEERSKVHSQGNGSGHEELARARVSDHEELKIDLGKEDNQEPPVAVNAFKHIEHWVLFRSELSAVKHVEEVHHHEGLEHESVVLKVIGWGHTISFVKRCLDQVVANSKHGWASEEQDKHDDSLVECLRSDCSPHEWGQDLVVLLDALSSEFCWVWGFS